MGQRAVRAYDYRVEWARVLLWRTTVTPVGGLQKNTGGLGDCFPMSVRCGRNTLPAEQPPGCVFP